MANPLILEYNAIKAAFERITKHKQLSEFTADERRQLISDVKFREFPVPYAHTVFDYKCVADPIFYKNFREILKRLQFSPERELQAYAPVNLRDMETFYGWIKEYVSYANGVLHSFGYRDINAELRDFQEIGECSPLNYENEASTSAVLNIADDSITAPVVQRDREPHDIELTIEVITALPSVKVHGVDPTKMMTIQEVTEQIKFINKTKKMYLIKNFPYVSTLNLNDIPATTRYGQHVNEIIEQVWMGNISEYLFSSAIGICVRIIREEIYVPDDSREIIGLPATAEKNGKLNALTSALLWFLGNYIIVYHLRLTNQLTKPCVSFAYEDLMARLDYRVVREVTEFSFSSVTDNIEMSYSISDVVGQLRGDDWMVRLWNACILEDADSLEYCYLWIKMALLRGGDAIMTTKKDQVVVPSPYVLTSFINCKPGSLVSREKFQREARKINERPVNLRDNASSHISYSYPPNGVWQSDPDDHFADVRVSWFQISLIHVLMAGYYSPKTIVEFFKPLR